MFPAYDIHDISDTALQRALTLRVLTTVEHTTDPFYKDECPECKGSGDDVNRTCHKGPVLGWGMVEEVESNVYKRLYRRKVLCVYPFRTNGAGDGSDDPERQLSRCMGRLQCLSSCIYADLWSSGDGSTSIVHQLYKYSTSHGSILQDFRYYKRWTDLGEDDSLAQGLLAARAKASSTASGEQRAKKARTSSSSSSSRSDLWNVGVNLHLKFTTGYKPINTGWNECTCTVQCMARGCPQKEQGCKCKACHYDD